MQTPKWLSLSMSFILVGLLIVVYILHAGIAPSRPLDQKQASVAGGRAAQNTALTFDHAITLGATHIRAAYAVTSAEQQQGLSGTSPLASDQGMLFFFAKPAIVPFWMKDMNYSLDILWIGADKQVKEITANLAPSTYPNVFASKVPVAYVLEAPAGFAQSNNIAVGAQLSF